MIEDNKKAAAKCDKDPIKCLDEADRAKPRVEGDLNTMWHKEVDHTQGDGFGTPKAGKGYSPLSTPSENFFTDIGLPKTIPPAP